MKNRIPLASFGVLAILLISIALMGAYTVDETEQVVITQFGKPVGEPVTTAGLKFKIPVLHEANFLDKRVLPWDGAPTSMPTKDKTYISVDTFARWQIKDPLQFLLRLREERSAQSRLDDILGSETRNVVAKNELIEIVRTSKDRVPVKDEELLIRNPKAIQSFKPIAKGRKKLEQEIFEAAADKLTEFGIELLDVRFKRIDYNPSVKTKIYSRMISERQQIAAGFRSEGAGEAAKINGNRERELKRIGSEAYKDVLRIRGEADAKSTKIYASAYGKTPDSIEFYEFLETMKVYESILDNDTTLVLTTDAELFRYLKDISPDDEK